MVKKNAKHVKSNHTKPQSSKTSVTMEEDKTSATVVQETELGNKKLLRHQEKIKREEEELKRLQAEKEKAEAAERSKKTSKKKLKNPEKIPSVVKMTENIPVVTNEETPEKLPEMPSEILVENESPPIKTLFVRPGTDQEWVETDTPQLSEDWNELIRKDEEPMTDDQKIQKQTDCVTYEVQDTKFPSTENLHQWSEYQNDRESNYRGKVNQGPKSIGHLEYRRGGGGNYHNNDNPRKKDHFGSRGEHSNYGQGRYNKPYGGRGGSRGHDRPSSSNEYPDYRNYDQTPNTEYTTFDKRGSRNDRPSSSNEPRNEYNSFDKRGARNDRPLSSNESGNSNNKNYSRGGRGGRNHRPSSSNEYPDFRVYDYRPPSNEVQNYGHSNRGSRGGNRNIETQNEGKQHESPRNSPNQNQFRERKDSGESSTNAKGNYNRGNRDSNQEDIYNRPPSRSNNYKSNYRNQSYNKKNTDEGNAPRFNQNRRNYNRRSPNNQSQSGDSNWSGSMAQSKVQTTSDDWGSGQNDETMQSSNDWVNPGAAPFEETAVSDANAVTPEEAMDIDESHNSNQSKKSYKTDMKDEDSYRTGPYKNRQYSRNDTNWRSEDDRKDSNKRSGDDRKDGNKRSGGDKRDNRKKGDRSDGDRRSIDEFKNKELDEVMRNKTQISYGKLSEKIGDLFKAPTNFSLAHCVAADLAMGAGIAVRFRSEFRRVGELLNQNQRTGGLAVLEDNGRFIYYLITKERSHLKPTNNTLWQSLLKLKEHCVEHDVTNLAIPQIGCGLDRLNWDDVKKMLEHIFRDVDINIVVYLLKEAEDTSRKPPKKGYVTHTKMLLKDIDPLTGLLYFGTEDAGSNPEIDSLAEKHNFVHAYKSAPKTAANVVKTIVGKEYLYGLIVRKTTTDKFDFVVFEKALRELRKILKQDMTEYIGFQAFKDDNSTLIVDKMLSLMQYILYDLNIWVCWPPELEEYCPQYP